MDSQLAAGKAKTFFVTFATFIDIDTGGSTLDRNTAKIRCAANYVFYNSPTFLTCPCFPV